MSLLDFSQPGDLGVFIDEEQVANLERKMNERGYLEGSEMAGTFNLPFPNDLVWSFVVNNYLLGKDPFPFDLLYWNADSTRMPARMHSFYLRNMYIKNLLGEPGGIELAGVPIELGEVKVPSYFISTVEDHIAPWKTTYKGARYLGGPVRFVLGGSGHIADIVNWPASANKYHYWTNGALPDTADTMVTTATQHPGSWWEDWQRWVEPLQRRALPAALRAKARCALEDAPAPTPRCASPLIPSPRWAHPWACAARRSEPIVQPAGHSAQQDRYERHLPRNHGEPVLRGDGARDAPRSVLGGDEKSMWKRLTRVIGVSM